MSGERFVETDAAEARLGQRHERAFLDPPAPVLGLGIAGHLPRVADRLQIAATISLKGARSGPAIFTTRLRGAWSAASATRGATSSAAIG